MTKKDRAISRIETLSRTGDNQPLTAVARALPADPSRADPMVTIHHHGSDASTVVKVASALRISCFMGALVSPWPQAAKASDRWQHRLGLVALQGVQLTLGRFRSAEPRLAQARGPLAVRR